MKWSVRDMDNRWNIGSPTGAGKQAEQSIFSLKPKFCTGWLWLLPLDQVETDDINLELSGWLGDGLRDSDQTLPNRMVL